MDESAHSNPDQVEIYEREGVEDKRLGEVISIIALIMVFVMVALVFIAGGGQ